MYMLTIEVPLEEIPLLRYEKYHHPILTVQKRAEIILLLTTAPHLSRGAIASQVDVCRNTVTNTIKRYQQGGLTGLTQVNFRGTQSELSPYEDSLVAYFEKNPVSSVSEAITKIEELTGITKSPTRVRDWMRKVGMKYQKTAQIPAKACPEKQEAWKTNVFEPLKQRAEAGEIVLLFGDAMHCVMGVFLSFLWSFTRVFIKSSPGRKRLNVIGALNAISKKVSYMTNMTRVNAETMMTFLTQLRDEYGDKPIHLILDNARYQHCKAVKEFAMAIDIHLVFLPPYSPNLNIIERLWKWTKKNAYMPSIMRSLRSLKKPSKKLWDKQIVNTKKNCKHCYP